MRTLVILLVYLVCGNSLAHWIGDAESEKKFCRSLCQDQCGCRAFDCGEECLCECQDAKTDSYLSCIDGAKRAIFDKEDYGIVIQGPEGKNRIIRSPKVGHQSSKVSFLRPRSPFPEEKKDDEKVESAAPAETPQTPQQPPSRLPPLPRPPPPPSMEEIAAAFRSRHPGVEPPPPPPEPPRLPEPPKRPELANLGQPPPPPPSPAERAEQMKQQMEEFRANLEARRPKPQQ